MFDLLRGFDIVGRSVGKSVGRSVGRSVGHKPQLLATEGNKRQKTEKMQ